MGKIADIIFNFFSSKNCLKCGKNGSFLCKNCLKDSVLENKIKNSPVKFILDYRKPWIKKAIWILKYKRVYGVADIFGEILWEEIDKELEAEKNKKYILLPVPLSKKRQKERGYNQAELICKKILKIENDKNLDRMSLETKILERKHSEKHQAEIRNKKERIENVKGIFSAKEKEKIIGKNFIIIDDVCTTGATLAEIKKILKQEGAKKTIAFTLAH